MNLACGATVLAGKFIGSGRKSAVSNILHVSMALAVFLGIIVTIAMYILNPVILRLMQTPDEVMDLALLYMNYFIAGIPGIAVSNFGAAILRAKGDTKRPLYFLFASGIVNVLLNLLFVIVLRMDVAGVALATTLSQYLSMALILICLLHEADDFHLDFKKIHFERSVLGGILRIGLPSAFQCLIFTISNSVIQAAINSFGPDVMAGNAAASNIESFVWVCMVSFEQAGMTFVSQNYGAHQIKRVEQIILRAMACTVATGLILGQLVVFFERQLLGVYMSDAASITEGVIRLHLLCGPYFLCGIMDSLSCDLRGLGYSTLPGIVTLLGACGTRLLWIFTGFQMPRFHSTHYLLLTYPVSWSITAAVHFVCLRFVLKKVRARCR